jgi:hypothetical protein
MRTVALIIVGLVVAVPALAYPPPSIPSLSTDQVTRLNNGEILVDMSNGDPPVGNAIGVVDAPPQRVLDVIADFPGQHQWLPDLEEATVVGQDGDRQLCHGVTDTPWPMNDREWTIRVWNGQMEVDGMQAWVSAWDYVPDSGNLRDTQGYWLMIPWGDDGQKTLVRHYLVLDLGTHLPDFLLNWATETMLPTRISALRQRLAELPEGSGQ